ncbi:hypothetical protein HNY73_012149 [Argiope bruennichi]|uniref:DUF4604 domain-containing protein n=1 Tax=Argiope bruennichi TaxID=94029 RepID=A0A8T0ETZ6_ARGBR|nr:hypothetical protein HNY73_012149 [Argiope bruennichi]
MRPTPTTLLRKWQGQPPEVTGGLASNRESPLLDQGISDAKEIRPFQDDDQEERDDEKPVIVVLNEGDLTEEQAKKITDKADLNKKITFAKPVKKDNEEKNSLDFSSKKKDDLQKKINIQKGKSESLKNTSLLSFGDEDEDEEDY